ncbi:SPOR domain-containing protein [Desulfovibrio sp. ZJ200]|uniref:SPOR domain-containing protein n=1 Tax=Desulfovibrio sp. ZJ200 TaxID=2709792 RepID=UPI0013EDE3CC|nr:SPOR domain-containing protein [Desulfovibrio sp. ZJ200]
MAFVTKKPNAGDQNPERSTPLRFSSLLTLCFLVLAAVVLAYVAGVMSGRAYSSRQSAAALQPAAHAAAGDSRDGDAAAARETPEKDPQILAPEELRFALALRGRAGEAAAREAGGPQAAQGGGADLAAAAAPAFRPAIPPATAQPAVPAPGAAGEMPRPQAANPAAMFDYVFQVAAFKDEDSVDALRQRLEGRGFRTRMQRDGKLYLVFVLLRGDAARAAEVPQIMHEMHLGAPIMRSRKPVL